MTTPARGTWRAWVYRRRWPAVMTIADLAPFYRGRIILPVLVKVTATRYVDRVAGPAGLRASAPPTSPTGPTTWPTGSAPCCAGSAPPGPGRWCWSSSAVTPWPPSSPPCPSPTGQTSRRCRSGRREDGLPWLVRLHGTHLLLAGATGAGKASLLWGLIRAMLPLMRAGLVRVLAADPKLMELAYGRVIFDTYGALRRRPGRHRRHARPGRRRHAGPRPRCSPGTSGTTPRPASTRSPWSWSMRSRS